MYISNARLPYAWKNPFGYLVTVTPLLLWAVYPFKYLGCFTFFTLGTYMFAIALVKVLKEELHSINKIATEGKSPNEMYMRLSKFIWMHADSKQLRR